MTEQAYNVLLKATDILLIVLILLSIYSLFTLIRRKGKSIVHISDLYLYLAFGIALWWPILLARPIFFDKSLITYDSEAVNSATNLLVSVLIFSLIGIFIQWCWCSYSIQIEEDKFIYRHLFFGKENILFEDIDINKSKYSFVYEKNDFIKLSSFEILYLVMKNGKEYKFRFEQIIFFISPFDFLFPKVRELGIKMDVIDLKYRKIEAAYEQETAYDSIGKSKNTNNDKILKRKKAKKAKKKAKNKKT